MANRERGEMDLTAGDKTYTLKLTTNATCELEDLSGKVLDDIMRQLAKGSSKALRWILWASLQEYHADVAKDVKDVGPIIDAAGGIVGVSEQLAKFAALNADDSEDVKANPKKAQADQAGETSTSRAVVAA